MAFFDPVSGKPVSGGVPGSPSFFGVGSGPQTAGGAAAPPVGAYQNVLQNDPIYQQMLRDLSAQGISDEAGARAQAQRAFINFGDVAGFDQPYSGWIDENTRRLAGENTAAGLSVSARLSKVNRDQIRTLRNMLAARGALRSGELGHQLGEENLRFSQAQYDARQQLTDFLSGVSAGLANAQRARYAQQAGGISSAIDRAPQTPPGGTLPPGLPPVPPPGTGGGASFGFLPGGAVSRIGKPDPWYPDDLRSRVL